jgi:hypothetical protein
MRQFKLFIVVYSLAIICFSCGKTEQKNQNEMLFSLVSEQEEVTIKIDEATPANSRVVFLFIQNGKEILSYLNSNLNQIQFYDLSSQKLIKAVDIEIDGPNGVGKVSGFRPLSLDSIFILPVMQTKLAIVNGEGEVLKKVDFSYTEDKYSSSRSNAWTHIYNTIEFDNDEDVNLSQNIQGHINSVTKRQLARTPIALTVNINNGIVKRLPLNYPEELIDGKGPRQIDMSRVNADEKYIYAFTTNHNLFITDSRHEAFSVKNGKSEYIDEIPTLPSGMGITEYQLNYRSSPRYTSLIYDPYRNIYYRFAYPGAEIDINNLEQYKTPIQFSVIIFDKDLNKVGETMLPKNTYLMDNFFVGKKGLYLSKNHPYNEKDFDEDFLTFEIFNVEEI